MNMITHFEPTNVDGCML